MIRINSLLAASGLAAAVAIACSGNDQTATVTGTTGGSNGSGANGSGASGGTLTGLVGGSNGSGGSAAAAASSASGGDGGACAAIGADGQPVPVDLYFMVDTTGSMNCPVPEDPAQPACEVDPGAPYSMTTRWTVESAALKSFIDSTSNAGLGVGIRFFPDSADICNATVYQTPAVAIGALPGNASKLDAAVAGATPGGNTPTYPSIQGALAYAKAYAMQNPTHKVAVVYSTDGYPKGCDASNTIPNAVAAAKAAAMGTPSIPTYVLGIGRNVSDLNSIAVAGGTTQAFLIDTLGDAATQLSTALASIRTQTAVTCQYIIPPAPAGETFNPAKVNVDYTNAAGMVTHLSQDATAGCTTGWQYSTDMKQINLCSDTCNTVLADSGAKVTVQFGCQTMVTGPK